MNRVAALALVPVALVSLSGCGVAAKAASQPPAKVQAPAREWAGTPTLTAQDALDAVAATPGAESRRPATSWSCTQPMTVTVAAAPGVDELKIRQQLEYPVAYLTALGYQVHMAGSTPYRPGMQEPETIGSVVVAATNRPADDPELVGSRGLSWRGMLDHHYVSATITVDAHRGLAGDVILHEFGHVLGLEHKDGTVMAAKGEAPVAFDAAETAAVDCRG